MGDLGPERRKEISTLFNLDWSRVRLVYVFGDRDLMDAWRLTWQKLSLKTPREMLIEETGSHGEFLRFTVRRSEMIASQILLRQQLKAMYYPQHALKSLSVSLDVLDEMASEGSGE